MKKQLISIIFFLLPIVVSAKVDELALYTNFQSENYSDNLPLESFLDSLRTNEAFQPGELTYTKNSLEVGGRINERFSLAAVARYDYFLKYHSDTLEVAFRDSNNLSFLGDRQYQLYVDARNIYGFGLKFGYDFTPIEKLNLKLSASYLKVRTTTTGIVDGQLTVDGNEYFGQVSIDYLYDSPRFFEPNAPGSTQGDGVAADLEVNWEINDHLHLTGEFKDLFNRFWFDDISFTSMNLNTNRISLDSNGLISTRPLLSGVRGVKKARVELPTHSSLSLTSMLNDRHSIGVNYTQYDLMKSPSIFYFRQQTLGGRVGFEFDFNSDAAALSYQNSVVAFRLKADSVDYNKAKNFSLEFSFSI